MGLDRIGTFRGVALEWGVSVTAQKKLPQFVVRAKLIEVYDQDEGKWFDYADFDAEVNAYLCLYGADKKKGSELGPTLNFEQVKKVFGWDGTSFVALANGDYSDLHFQLRIGENTYEGAKTPYQVDWIDETDADPVRQLRKLDAKELKELDKQFAAQSKQPVKAVSAVKATKPHPARVPADDGVLPTAEEKKKILKAKSDRLKAEAAKAKAKAEPPEAPEPSKMPEAPPGTGETEGSCTKNEAWCGIAEMRDETIDDKTIIQCWNDAMAEVAGPEAVTKEGQTGITGEQWFQVKEIVLKDCAKF